MKDEILELIFAHPEMQSIPLGCQSTAVSVFSEVLEKIKEEKPYVTVTELFQSTDAGDTADISEL